MITWLNNRDLLHTNKLSEVLFSFSIVFVIPHTCKSLSPDNILVIPRIRVQSTTQECTYSLCLGLGALNSTMENHMVHVRFYTVPYTKPPVLFSVNIFLKRAYNNKNISIVVIINRVMKIFHAICKIYISEYTNLKWSLWDLKYNWVMEPMNRDWQNLKL